MPNEHIASILGISSSVVVFIVVTSICFTLSLSSTSDSKNFTSCGSDYEETSLVPKCFPNMAMIIAMTIGIVAMVALVIKRDDLTTEGHECQLTRRHNLHSTLSLRSIILFYVLTSTLDLNYLIVEVSCWHRWIHCDYSVILDNVFELLFRIACFTFVSCETIVCWVMKPRNFKQSQWVWHGLAIIQAANISIWFNSLLDEASHRISAESSNFYSYFCFCNASSNFDNDSFCSSSSMASSYFLWSRPFLFPITIEFALLVSENLLDRVAGCERHYFDQSGGPNVQNAHHDSSGENTDEEPLLSRNEHLPQEIDSCTAKISVLLSFIINIVYMMFSVLLIFGQAGDNTEWQTYANAFTVYGILYDLFFIVCCAVGIQTCRAFRRPYSHTSFLEYLMLFATSGILLENIKDLVYLPIYGMQSSWVIAYYIADVVDVIQPPLQIIFYYIAKDVKLRLRNGGQADDSSRATVFRTILIIISVSNLVNWISDSFVLPEIQQHITPSNYSVPMWPVFDNVVTPLSIFFRFNSALLFWCIGTDVLQPGELHEN